MYNSDGSETGACGNGTRCVADYIMNKENLNTVNIETISGELKCSRSENGIKVNMGLPKFSWRDIPLAYKTDNLKVALDEFNACCISIGNPHAVIFMSNLSELENLNLELIGPRLEKNSIFPDFANIEFACVTKKGIIRICLLYTSPSPRD